MAAPNPGALNPNEAPSSAKIIWGIRTDGKIVPVAVGDDGSLVTGAAALQTTPDLTYARINRATSGDGTAIVAATASMKTRVYRMKLSVAGAVIVTIKDGAGTTLEVFNFAGNGGGVVLDFSERPWYTGTANTAFYINLSAAVQVDGSLEYTLAA